VQLSHHPESRGEFTKVCSPCGVAPR
jgi:hypothetical protein